MSDRPLSIFGLDAAPENARRIARHLGAGLAPHEERRFEDGEHKTRPLADVEGHDVVVVHSLYGDAEESSADKLCRLAFFCGAVKDAGADRVTAVTPYLCYSRKDRRTKPRDPIATRYVASMIEAVGIDRVVTIDVHNPAAFENAFRIPTLHVESTELFAEYFASRLAGGGAVAVSPDPGGAKRAERFREVLAAKTGQDVGGAYVEKHRSGGVLTGDLLAGDVKGRAAIIIDDMISSGSTLLRAATACRKAGARQVFAAATHGLFIGGSDALFGDALDGVVIGDTVPPFRLSEANRNRLAVIDTSAVLAAAVKAIHR